MRVRVLKEAENELLQATLYYEDRREGLGWDFHTRVNETMLLIAERAQHFPIYEGKALSRELRRAPVPRFPYIIVFEVRPHEIVVIAVAHTSREPGYWEDRRTAEGQSERP